MQHFSIISPIMGRPTKFHVTSGLTGSERLCGSEYIRTVHYPVLLTAAPAEMSLQFMLPFQLHLLSPSPHSLSSNTSRA
jgi:hypothetical protein